MKSKFLITLFLMLVLSFASCGEDTSGATDNSGSAPSDKTTYVRVTKEEWINAFNLDGVNSGTILFSDKRTVPAMSSPITLEGYSKFIKEYGIECKTSSSNLVKDSVFSLTKEKLTAFNVVIKECVFEDEYNDWAKAPDYNFSLFTYNESNGCFEYTVEDGTVKGEVRIYFDQNKRLSKISHFSKKLSSGQTEESVITFTDYDKTKFTLPAEIANNLYKETLHSVDNWETVEIAVNGGIPYQASMNEDFSAFLSGIDFSKATLFDQFDSMGEVDTFIVISLNEEKTDVFFDNEVTYDEIRLSIHNKTLFSVFLQNSAEEAMNISPTLF